MNIYTLHKEGSFRPPSLDCDSEIENSHSNRDHQPGSNLEDVAEEKSPQGSTSITSGTSASSSGEKTTPRQNVRSPASASRIDATGVITDTNTAQPSLSKVLSNLQPSAAKVKVKKSSFPSCELKKGRRKNGLIHIQARDEFMIFQDNTDLVSHITTPSAVRTSPLETDFLIIDHDEFAEDQTLLSAITVPKALRKKKNKKRKSRAKNGGIKKVNNIEEEKSKNEEDPSKNQEQTELILAPATTSDESVEIEIHKPEEPQDFSASPLPKQNSLDHSKSSSHSKRSSESSSRSNKSELREESRELKPTDQAGKPLCPILPMTREEMDRSSQDDQEKVRSEIPSPSSQHEAVEEEKENDSQQEQKMELPEEETSKHLPSISQMESADKTPAKSRHPQEEEYSKPSPSISKAEATDNSLEKPRLAQGQEQGSGYQDDSNKSPEPGGIQKPKIRKARKHYSDVGIKNGSDNMKRDDVAKAALYTLDVTARTHLDSTTRTANEGSVEFRKVPHSQRRGKFFKTLCLPTSHFCNQKKKKREKQEQAQRMEEERTKLEVQDFYNQNKKNREKQEQAEITERQ